MHVSNYESYFIYYICDIFHFVVDIGITSKQEAPTRPLHIVSPRNVAYIYSGSSVHVSMINKIDT